MQKNVGVLEIIKGYFRYLEELGFYEVPLSPELSSWLGKKETITGASFEALFEKISNCTDCPLHRIRKQPVFESPMENQKLMLIAEYPDRDDDYYGKPFSGQVKETLKKMLLSIGLRKEDFYITYVVKCKPSAGRLPEEEEISACKKYLLKEIKLFKPKLILALGFIPPKAFFDKPETFSTLRGKPITYKESLILFTYHPAYMLKNPAVKRLIWEDLKTFKRLYEEKMGKI